MTDEDEIMELIERYGFEWIIGEFDMKLWQVLDLLNQLGYIDLERYTDGEMGL